MHQVLIDLIMMFLANEKCCDHHMAIILIRLKLKLCLTLTSERIFGFTPVIHDDIVRIILMFIHAICRTLFYGKCNLELNIKVYVPTDALVKVRSLLHFHFYFFTKRRRNVSQNNQKNLKLKLITQVKKMIAPPYVFQNRLLSNKKKEFSNS